MLKNTLIFISVILTTQDHVQGVPPPPYTKELESNLRNRLFSDYDVNQRPRKRVTVYTALNLLSLNYLDIKEQKMSITGYFHFAWKDSRLSWMNYSKYDNIRFLFTSEKYVWTPAIVIENSVEDIDVISKPKVPMRVVKTGMISWLPGGIFTTHCESDVTYWPLDTQKCDVITTSWGYTAAEVDLIFDDTVFVTESYHENGEWELQVTNHSTITTKRELERFSRLIFSVTYRRRPLFHMLNTLFPVVLMGFLTVAIFKLNPESGERVDLALTILLAYAVYLSLISESIPQTSLSASLLSTYLASILLLQTLAVFLTVLYLDIYFRPVHKPIPRWIQAVTSCCLVKLSCVECGHPSNRVKPETQSNQSQPRFRNEDDSEVASVSCIKTKIEFKEDDGIKRAWSPNDDVVDDVNNLEPKYSWKEIALMLDKVTMYIYLILVCSFSLIVFGLMVVHYKTAYTIDFI